MSFAPEGAYYDQALGREVRYRATAVKRGAGSMFGAGVLSGLLGIGAGIFFGRGDVHPLIAGPVAIGVLLGAYLGTHLLARLRNTTVRRLFLVVVFYLSLSMILRGLGIRLP